MLTEAALPGLTAPGYGARKVNRLCGATPKPGWVLGAGAAVLKHSCSGSSLASGFACSPFPAPESCVEAAPNHISLRTAAPS